jgi:hypothetical protein
VRPSGLLDRESRFNDQVGQRFVADLAVRYRSPPDRGGARGPIERAGPILRASILSWFDSHVAPSSRERSATHEKRSGRIS